MGNKKIKPTRRQFLKGFGAGAIGSQFLNFGLAPIFASAAHASSSLGKTSDTKYIYFQHQGGPARYMFDAVFDPKGTGNLIPNPCVGSHFDSDGKIVYDTISYQGTHIPYMWKSKIATSRSPQPVTMVRLLDHALILTGYTTATSSHELSSVRHLLWPNSTGSLHGMIADQSQTPIPIIDLSPGSWIGKWGYRSEKKTPKYDMSSVSSASLMAIFKPLLDLRSSGFANKFATDKAFREVYYTLKSKHSRLGDAAKALFSAYDDFLSLLQNDSIENADTEYLAIHKKYKSLLYKTVREVTFDGVSNRSIVSDGGDSGSNLFVINRDKVSLAAGYDLNHRKEEFSPSGSLISMMAMIEYLITKEITSVVVAGGSPGQFRMFTPTSNASPFSGANTGSKDFGMGSDAHYYGGAFQLFANLHYYRLLVAGLYELTETLKEKNLFNRSIIQVGGDFGRNPRTDGAGTDHDGNACSTLILSGMFDKFNVFGNTIREHSDGNHVGTYGKGAVMESLGGERLHVGHIMSSIATMAGVKSPRPNDRPILIKNEKMKKAFLRAKENKGLL
ncbi:MAG: DUF1501 domain-containing protein [Bacteriovoracaceae bacterium]